MPTARVGAVAATAGLAAVIALSAPGDAGAQAAAKAAEIGNPSRGGFLAEEARRAELVRRLRGEADRLESSFRWERAAPLYERAARLASPENPDSHAIYAAAARCYYFSEEDAEASRLWEAAGERAQQHGDAGAAAESFLKAALAAREDGNAERASLNGLRALALTESEQMSEATRSRIREHLRLRTVVLDGRP